MVSKSRNSYLVERRSDGSVLVRVRSADRNGHALPDAVFTFRSGDPQYGFWEERAGSIYSPQEAGGVG
jgi:hypothetical protein